jgi:hypothetical protein
MTQSPTNTAPESRAQWSLLKSVFFPGQIQTMDKFSCITRNFQNILLILEWLEIKSNKSKL